MRGRKQKHKSFSRGQKGRTLFTKSFFFVGEKILKINFVAKIKGHFCRAKINQVGTQFATVVIIKGSWTKCESRGYRENFWRAKMYAVQGFFSAAQGERNFVQKGGRNS